MTQLSPPSPAVLSAISEAGTGLLQSKYLLFGAYAAAIYDHVVTLDIEIECMWMHKISAVTLLFFVTRYYFIAVLTVALFVFYQPLVSIKEVLTTTLRSCERALLFIPIGGGTILSAATNLIITLRIYALYERNKMLGLLLLVCILGQIGLGLWNDLSPVSRLDIFAALGYPQLDAVPTLHSCLPQLSTKLPGAENSLSQIVQLIFDTVAVILILFKARKHGNGGLVALIAKQGLVYYILNIGTYFSWAFMLMFAPASIEQVMAGPAIGLLCISVNRLTLHLRRSSTDSRVYVDGGSLSRTFPFSPRGSSLRRRSSWLGASTLEVSAETWGIGEQEVHELHGVAPIN